MDESDGHSNRAQALNCTHETSDFNIREVLVQDPARKSLPLFGFSNFPQSD